MSEYTDILFTNILSQVYPNIELLLEDQDVNNAVTRNTLYEKYTDNSLFADNYIKSYILSIMVMLYMS